eukprot:3703861-Pyramimonas_sp.AAC.2
MRCSLFDGWAASQRSQLPSRRWKLEPVVRYQPLGLLIGPSWGILGSLWALTWPLGAFSGAIGCLECIRGRLGVVWVSQAQPLGAPTTGCVRKALALRNMVGVEVSVARPQLEIR